MWPALIITPCKLCGSKPSKMMPYSRVTLLVEKLVSHRPHKLCTTLTPAQEAIVVALRSLTLLALDDLRRGGARVHHPEVSRSGLDRCVANLRQLQAEALAMECILS